VAHVLQNYALLPETNFTKNQFSKQGSMFHEREKSCYYVQNVIVSKNRTS